MSKRKNKILVVDDNDKTREILVENLSLKGYKVDHAGSAEKALEKIKNSTIDLFLIDIVMPEISGIELLEKLDVKNNLYEAIMITGYSDLDSAKEAMQLGAFSYISKPISYEDLDLQIEKALKIVSLKQDNERFMKMLKEQADKAHNDILELTSIIYFIEEVANKIHGLVDADKIFSVVTDEFGKEEEYDCSILLLDGKGMLIIEKTSNVNLLLNQMVEKVDGFKMKAFNFLESKSFCEAIEQGKTIQADSRIILEELFPELIVHKVEKILNYENKEIIIVPLKKNREIIGVFCMNNPKLIGFFAPSVENLCMQISSALEHADDHAERKKAENELKVSEKKYKSLSNELETILDLLPVVIFYKDTRNNFIRVNKYFAEVQNLTKKEMEGKSCFELFPKNQAQKYWDDDLEVINSGKPKLNFEESWESAEGTRWVNTNKVPYIDERGEVKGVLGIALDITDRKLAEEQLKSSRVQLQNLAAHLQSAREEERMSIAREIHDELGQVLSALKMDFSWLSKRLPKDMKALIEKIESMNELIDSSIATIKRISAELRPGLLDDLGLVAAIEWQSEKFAKRTGIKCRVKAEIKEQMLNKDYRIALCRIVQEALTNIGRHANATRAKVSLKMKAKELELRVSDNGKGIDEKQVADRKSLGLIGIKERARSLCGEATIQGVQGKGTTVTVKILLPNKGSVL